LTVDESDESSKDLHCSNDGPDHVANPFKGLDGELEGFEGVNWNGEATSLTLIDKVGLAIARRWERRIDFDREDTISPSSYPDFARCAMVGRGVKSPSNHAVI